MKDPASRFRFVELYLPSAFEVDGVNQEHDDVRRDPVHDFLNFALCVCVYPLIDAPGRLWIAEVQRGHLCVEEHPISIEEVIIKFNIFPCLDRVRNGEFDFRIRILQIFSQLGVGPVNRL